MYPTLQLISLATLILACTAGYAEIKQITVRTSAQTDIAGEEEVIDGCWIAIGTSDKRGASVSIDTDNPFRAEPVYRFCARDDSVNRIEFSEVYGSEENLASLTEEDREAALAIKDGYINSEVGRYGDTVNYEWSTRFPEAMTAETRAIFAQWHGRPDRTLVEDEKGTRVLPIPEFLRLQKTMEFKKDGWGYSRRDMKLGPR